MALTKLGIQHFRNLHQVAIEPHPKINLIIGANASGKTSLLEAIYFLSRAGSFRTNRFDRLLENGQESLSVHATKISKTGKKVHFGVKKSAKQVQIRINEQKISKTSALVKNLPVQVIHPNSHQLMEEGPQFRRQFVDWGVFHVEHEFYPVWLRYRKALKQRNTALKQMGNKTAIQAWDAELIQSGEQIDRYRRQYLKQLSDAFEALIQPVLGNLGFDLEYRQGWVAQQTLQEALQASLSQDCERGFTACGPQRADMLIRVDGRLASERISRGQQKLLVTCLLLAQAALYNKLTSEQCLLLIDDVAAELDEQNRANILQHLRGMQVQMFMTALDAAAFSELSSTNEKQVFHVEQGTVTASI